jgi:hypothetical protein
MSGRWPACHGRVWSSCQVPGRRVCQQMQNCDSHSFERHQRLGGRIAFPRFVFSHAPMSSDSVARLMCYSLAACYFVPGVKTRSRCTGVADRGTSMGDPNTRRRSEKAPRSPIGDQGARARLGAAQPGCEGHVSKKLPGAICAVTSFQTC